MDPVRNPAVCDCSINHNPFGSFSPGSNPDRDYECHAVCDKGRCGFTLRVEAGQMRFELVQYGYQYGIEILAKIFEHDPKTFFTVS
jgi:hypothetical protein